MSEDPKQALVTGASKGIGRGIALALAEAGWDVAVNFHRDQEGAEQTVRQARQLGGNSFSIQADVGDGQQVRDMFQRVQSEFGGLRLLVNNAGVQTWCPLLELKEEDWHRTLRTNLTGCFLCTQQAGLMMRETGGGIINIGSGCNRVPFPNLVDYTAAKGGIEMLTKVSAVELGPYKIRVNCVAPGAIEIERTKLEAPDYAGTWAPLTPLRRVGQASDVASVVLFLASEAASFTTGQTVHVDGGLWTRGTWPYDNE